MKDCILLAACEAHETLPQSAEFPADVFTACLTTPIKMALRWYGYLPFYCLILLMFTILIGHWPLYFVLCAFYLFLVGLDSWCSISGFAHGHC